VPTGQFAAGYTPPRMGYPLASGRGGAQPNATVAAELAARRLDGDL
jgi:hypothetical protein